MKITITNRFTGASVYECEADSLRAALEECTKLGRNLSGGNLSGANLSGADISGANLSGANLSGANLSGADISGANLSGADVYGANLSWADLSGANLSRANLSWADLSGANLSRANLYRADISGANLSGANLYRADISGANLSGAKNADLLIAQTRILPEGSVIGYKKVSTPTGTGIVVLHIPAYAKRSHAFGRKCRCEFAEVVEAPEGAFTNQHGPRTEYRAGEVVKADSWDENWQEECSHGIHFFITRIEAENYQ